MAKPKPRVEPLPQQLPPPGAVAIPLTRGWVAWVDSGDAGLARHAWHAMVHAGHGSAARKSQVNLHSSVVMMHSEILGASPGETDHIRRHDGIKVIDNRRQNLRHATQQQNMANVRPHKGGTSIFKGVSWDAARRKWSAKIKAPIQRNLGRFAVEAHAALVYDLAAVSAFGDRALTNFPVPGSTNWLFD